METAADVDRMPPAATRASAREAAIALARSGAPLNWRELAAILQIGRAMFFRNAARGDYNFLLVKVPLGPRKYSGVLVERWLNGEPVYLPTFGRKRL